MKTFYTILGLVSLLTFQACTATKAPTKERKDMSPTELSKANMGKCTSCHGADYSVNALRISKRVVSEMTKEEILKSLTALQKQDILKDSLKFSELKVHQLTPADIALVVANIKK